MFTITICDMVKDALEILVLFQHKRHIKWLVQYKRWSSKLKGRGRTNKQYRHYVLIQCM